AAKAVEFEQHLLRRNGPEGKIQPRTGNARVSSGATGNVGTRPEPEVAVYPLPSSYIIVTVPRARRVHQSLLTAPFSTLLCFWACLRVLQGKHPDQKLPQCLSASAARFQPLDHLGYPDIILTNGPATAVCMIIAARLLRVLNSVFPHGPPQHT